jgi:hypothetical protein
LGFLQVGGLYYRPEPKIPLKRATTGARGGNAVETKVLMPFKTVFNDKLGSEKFGSITGDGA